MRRSGWLSASVLSLVLAGTAGAVEYRVRGGDTLSAIASRFGVSVESICAANGISDADTISVGAVLQIPERGGASADVHVVRDGESLWMIALRHRVTTVELMRANGLRGDVIHAGDRLRIPGGGVAAPASEPEASTSAPVAGVSAADLEIMARIVKGECPPDTPFEGKVAVAAVILNRVRAAGYPDSIEGVAHQPLQFSCYNRNVRRDLYLGRIPQAAWDAARAAAAGRDPSGGATHYFNPFLVRPAWARDMRFLKRIGASESTTHDFYR